MVPFAGFEMPVVYGSIVEEHRAVRESAGLFDVSHMGEVRLRGSDALELAQRIFTNNVAKTAVGRVRYGLLCLDDGGVVDDVTLYRTDEHEVMLCVNASNVAADLEWIRSVHKREGFKCEVIDESPETSLIAIQGPQALEIAGACLQPSTQPPGRWRFDQVELAGIPVCLSRTGYTGEDGYEIYVNADRAVEVWESLVEAGGDRLTLCGLGARDTLRTEMAYPLYGHELDRSHTPIEAGLERFIQFGLGFCGEEALQAKPAARKLVGLELKGRQVPRTGYPIMTKNGPGVVTSGTYGPSVERSIAIGYVPASCSDVGNTLEVEIRGRRLPCDVVATPFYDRKA